MSTRRVTDDSERSVFQSDRFFVSNGQWFFNTREATTLGPFARRLAETLRATDLIMRAGEYEWFILSPQNDRAGLLVLLQLIEKLAAATEQSDGNRIAVTANCVTSEEIKDLGIGARVLLSELQGGTR